jgi:hypothetical protein
MFSGYLRVINGDFIRYAGTQEVKDSCLCYVLSFW